MNVGVIIRNLDEKIGEKIAFARSLGMETCQLNCWDKNSFTDEMAEKILTACKEHGMKISSLWCGWSGPAMWNFYEGPKTLGLVPEEYRKMRVEELKLGSDFAKKLGVENLVTHVGYIPENPNDPTFTDVVLAVREVAERCKENGQYFLFETGQETPVTLLRTIEEIGLDNLGINLDPANLIMYGKANPIDALDVFGKYVRDVHAKDGRYPTCGKELGPETPIGEGKVNFPAFIKKLREIGYDGSLTIEREISGEQQIKDIKAAKKLLDELIRA